MTRAGLPRRAGHALMSNLHCEVRSRAEVVVLVEGVVIWRSSTVSRVACEDLSSKQGGVPEVAAAQRRLRTEAVHWRTCKD